MDTKESVMNIHRRLYAERLAIMKRLGMLSSSSKSSSAKAAPKPKHVSTRSSEKHRRAEARHAEELAAATKTRKALRGDALFLSQQGIHNPRLAVGAPLVPIEGRGYHKANLALTRARRTIKKARY
jgi:hypothetical protein